MAVRPSGHGQPLPAIARGRNAARDARAAPAFRSKLPKRQSLGEGQRAGTHGGMEGADEDFAGQTVVMRPYLRMFVEKYHAWMVRNAMESGHK